MFSLKAPNRNTIPTMLEYCLAVSPYKKYSRDLLSESNDSDSEFTIDLSVENSKLKK